MSALVSFFPSFDGDCQSGSFLIQRNRDKLSARKFGVGVFTQPGSLADLASRGCDVRSPPEADIQRCDGDVRFVPVSEVGFIRSVHLLGQALSPGQRGQAPWLS